MEEVRTGYEAVVGAVANGHISTFQLPLPENKERETGEVRNCDESDTCGEERDAAGDKRGNEKCR